MPEFDGGDWSTYRYDGFIYESDITRGLTIWRLNDPAVGGSRDQNFSNPRTQTFSIHSSNRIGSTEGRPPRGGRPLFQLDPA